jgi:hypothetical protein
MKQTKKTKMSHRLAAAATMGMMAASGTAHAATDANSLVNNLITSSAGFTQLINLFGYIGGTGLAVAGIFKIKQHTDSPANVPLKDGIMRLAAGGALLSLPFMTQVMQGSIGEGNSGSTITISHTSNFS